MRQLIGNRIRRGVVADVDPQAPHHFATEDFRKAAFWIPEAKATVQERRRGLLGLSPTRPNQ
ncbi:hypothetical protein [Luteimonas terrae]|uniref:Uncharacterized protein n=1 Tax=Luteimonas terrae TaxID=1530191 RepID=A0ABU1Y0Y9_9GAMM|nr:hypothetical protein [Luteimonas terrae]MDR7194684.1 hypothetical protein [Luteimonas terrae]